MQVNLQSNQSKKPTGITPVQPAINHPVAAPSHGLHRHVQPFAQSEGSTSDGGSTQRLGLQMERLKSEMLWLVQEVRSPLERLFGFGLRDLVSAFD